jgi:hypothetical protein
MVMFKYATKNAIIENCTRIKPVENTVFLKVTVKNSK